MKGAGRVGRRGVLTNDHKGEVETSADGLSVHLVWKRGESDELIFVLQTHTHDTTHCTLRLVLYGEVNKLNRQLLLIHHLTVSDHPFF